MIWGFQAAGSPRGMKDGMPAFLYFLFGSGALLCAALDVRMLRRGGFVGPKRILRHLGRMCFALLIATVSFYPGQAKLFPASVKATNLLFVPHVLLIGSMIFWTVRMRRRSKKEPAPPSERTDPAWPGPAPAVAQSLMPVHRRSPT